jgi:hypothetical protein
MENLMKRIGIHFSSALGTTHSVARPSQRSMKGFRSCQSTISTANQPFTTIEDAICDGSRPYKPNTIALSNSKGQDSIVEMKDIIAKDESVYWESASVGT